MNTDYNSLIFEVSTPGQIAYDLPKNDVPEFDLVGEIDHLARKEAAELPEVAELQLLRHYTLLSNKNFGVETGPYPLGSCTMKYNPKINEVVAGLDGFAGIHPLQDPDTVQGALEMLYNLQQDLKAVTGMDEITLQPAAGAHGELAAILVFKAYLQAKGETKRNKILVPDSAHGTNPATAAVAGFTAVEIPSLPTGTVDVEALRAAVGEDTAGIMLTNPNTVGLFEKDILEIADIVHEAGGLLYYDGANTNGMMGITNPGRMGFDAVHLNLHKSFSGPHGGGGPGSGPIGVKSFLAPYLPVPRVEKEGDKFVLNSEYPESIGRVKGALGNFGVNLRGYTYIRALGAEGLRKVCEDAVLNANYLKARIQDYYDTPYKDQFCKHEFVVSVDKQKHDFGVSAKDVGKRLLDFGIHAPTTYFPLIVHECLMIEPTETESKRDLDRVADAFIQIAKEAEENAELVTGAPHVTSVKRLDEALASRKPVVTENPKAVAEQQAAIEK